MIKIRIGNDINLTVNLLGTKNIDAININSINAYLINKTKHEDLLDQQHREQVLMQDEMDARKARIKYVSRFPVEPYPVEFRPTPYDLCCGGIPGYHARPLRYVPVYHGYGVYPHTHEYGTWRKDDMEDLYVKAGFKYMDMQREYDRCRFLAPVEATDSKNKIEVLFPAEAQLYTGVYKLVIVAKIYEHGYAKNNLRTVTMDYEDVFEIVSKSDQEGMDTTAYITVGNEKQATNVIINGTSVLRKNSDGQLSATVLPYDIDDNSVMWEVVSGNSVLIAFTDATSCKLRSGEATGETIVRATSVKTPEVYAEIAINVVEGDAQDIYVNDTTALKSGKLNLTRTDGGQVEVDLSNETEWFVGG